MGLCYLAGPLMYSKNSSNNFSRVKVSYEVLLKKNQDYNEIRFHCVDWIILIPKTHILKIDDIREIQFGRYMPMIQLYFIND